MYVVYYDFSHIPLARVYGMQPHPSTQSSCILYVHLICITNRNLISALALALHNCRIVWSPIQHGGRTIVVPCGHEVVDATDPRRPACSCFRRRVADGAKMKILCSLRFSCLSPLPSFFNSLTLPPAYL